jgi:hypothetical protein
MELAAGVLCWADEEPAPSVDVQLEALVALLTDALRASSQAGTASPVGH